MITATTKTELLDSYRRAMRMSVEALARQIDIPAHVLRRVLQGDTKKPRDYHQDIIDTYVARNLDAILVHTSPCRKAS
jgi:hypothetical protein